MKQLHFEFLKKNSRDDSISFEKKTERELVRNMAEAIISVIASKENKSNGDTTDNEQDSCTAPGTDGNHLSSAIK